jgi:hypothetical protein
MASKFDPNIYMGNPDLPSVKATFEYTPEQIKEIQKCAKNITHFAQSHFYITTLDNGKQKIKLYAPQKRIIKSLGKHNRVCVLASRQTGKCVYEKTLIKIRNKQTLVVEELTIGEFHNRLKLKKEL